MQIRHHKAGHGISVTCLIPRVEACSQIRITPGVVSAGSPDLPQLITLLAHSGPDPVIFCIPCRLKVTLNQGCTGLQFCVKHISFFSFLKNALQSDHGDREHRMTQFQTPEDRLRAAIPGMTRALRQLASHTLGNFPLSVLGTMAVIAKDAGVSASTVVRFVRKIGFTGYPELRAQLHEETRSIAEYFTTAPHVMRSDGRCRAAYPDITNRELESRRHHSLKQMNGSGA